jgi:hypothetical protein
VQKEQTRLTRNHKTAPNNENKPKTNPKHESEKHTPPPRGLENTPQPKPPENTPNLLKNHAKTASSFVKIVPGRGKRYHSQTRKFAHQKTNHP